MSAGENPKAPAMTAEEVLHALDAWCRCHPDHDHSVWCPLPSRLNMLTAYSAAQRLNRDMEWWEQLVLVDNVAPTPEAAKAWLLNLSAYEQRALEEENARLRFALSTLAARKSPGHLPSCDCMACFCDAALRAKEASKANE